MRFAGGLTAVMLFLSAASALAQPARDPIELQKEAARALAENGLDLAAAGKYGEAVERFDQAEARFHAPTHILFAARALAKLGKLAQAEARYRRVLDEKLPDYAPSVFREAQAQARVEVEQLRARVPSVTIVIEGNAPAGAMLTVDGTAAALGSDPIHVDPGSHAIAFGAPGIESMQRSVSVVEGDHKQVLFTFSTQKTADASAPPPSTSGSVVPAIVAFSLGGAALGVGAVTGALSFAKVSDLSKACPSKQNCTSVGADLASSAKTLGSVSTVMFIASGIAVTTGVVLFVARPSGRSKPGATVRLGPGAMSLSGTF